MELRRLSENEQGAYDRFVAEHPSGSFLQAWDWGRFQEILGAKVHRFFVEKERQIELTAQAIEIAIPHLGQTYLYLPYGPLWSNESAALFFLQQLRQTFPQSLFVRIEAKDQLSSASHDTINIQPGKTLVLDVTQTLEQLLGHMHPKTRYNIKVAQRHGVKIIREPIVTPGHGLFLVEALDLLVQTAKRQGFRSHPASYYQKLIDFFSLQTKPNGCRIEVYRAVLGSQLLATAIMMDFGFTRTYLFGGTSDQHKNVMAPYALHWQAIQDAQKAGLTQYDFWGIETASGKTPGFVRFKLGWGGKEVAYAGAQDLTNRPAWYTIYNVLRKLNRKF